MKTTNTDQAAPLFLERVRQLLAHKCITQFHLAERTGISPANISRMLSGRHNMRLDMLLRLLEAADIEIVLIKKRKK